MAKASPQLTAFNAGELSPLLEARTEIPKYKNGCALMDNYIPTVQGPAIRRPGTRYVSEVKNSVNKTWLVKFEKNYADSFILEFGDQYIRFYTQHGQVQVVGAAAWNIATAYTFGDVVSYGGVNYWCRVLGSSGAQPDISPSSWYAMTGSIFEIKTPYAIADLTNADGSFALSIAQSIDVMYIAHRKYPMQKLSHYSSTRWSLIDQMSDIVGIASQSPRIFGGPFADSDGTTTVYAASATGLNVALTASAPLWNSNHVGSLFYLGEKDVRAAVQWEAGKAYALGAVVRSGNINYKALNAATSGTVKPTHTVGAVFDGTTGVQWQYLNNGIGIVFITGFVSSTQVTASIIGTLPDGCVGAANASLNWGQSIYNASDGWPSEVSFFHERLVLARDQHINLSVAGDYLNFNSRDESGNVVSDMAISIQLQSRKTNSINWLEPGSDMIIGTSGGEFILREMTRNQVFGAGNTTLLQQSEFGTSSMRPQRVGYSTVFLQRAGTKVREMSYDMGADNYKAYDTTLLSEHITKGGLASSAYQQDPYSIIWYARKDGKLVGFTFNKEQDVQAWHSHTIGGSGFVESVAAIPSPDGTRSDLWLIVNRTINGVSKRYIEYLEQEHTRGDDPYLSFYVDAGLTYDGKVNATLTPGSGCTTAHSTGITFSASSAVWSAGDVGREIQYRYATIGADVSGAPITVYKTAKALITAYTDSQHVTCTINSAFPSTSAIAANAWRMTATTLSGLSHLEGQTVDVLVNGASHPQRTVTGGSITLQNAGSIVHVGLPCPAKLKTMRLTDGGADGTSQGKTARINKATLRMLETLGMKYGHSFANMDEVNIRTALDQMDNAPPLFTGDIVLDWPGEYDTHPWLCFANDQPLPSTIVGIYPQVTVQDR